VPGLGVFKGDLSAPLVDVGTIWFTETLDGQAKASERGLEAAPHHLLAEAETMCLKSRHN
jgi:hypothetical protein